MLVMKSGKRHLTYRMELPNQDKITTLGKKETYKHVGILEADTIKQEAMKEKKSRKNMSEEPESYSRQNYKGLDNWTHPHVRYSKPKKLNKCTRKLMTTHNVLHPRDNVDRLYMPRKEGARGLTSIEDNVDASVRLEDYLQNHGRRLITANRNNINTRTNKTTITRKQKWKEKQLYGRFKWLKSTVSHKENLDLAKKVKP